MTELTKEQVEAIHIANQVQGTTWQDVHNLIFTLRKAWAERDENKRKADALDKLTEMIMENSYLEVGEDLGVIRLVGISMCGDESYEELWRFTAPTLLEAIEKA
jgi:hypothetical protein